MLHVLLWIRQPLEHRVAAKHIDFSSPGTLVRPWMESLYRAYTALCILIQGTIDCGQFFLLTTS